jgi:glyoxylase-like metal-dependent hydrolase (beta-lactamase superfamily II)
MGDADLPLHEVYAVKYAERDARRSDHFLGGDTHDALMPMDYFVWVVRGGGRTFVVDTGFEQADADARGRRLLRSVTEGLATVGVDAATVPDVVITHLHYDHVGGFAQFPSARFHVQDREVAYATGRHMTHENLSHAFTADHIARFVGAVFAGRVVFHEGDVELSRGLSVHHVGGHTDGLQVVRVHTAAGWIVLASDATHFYENLESGRPFPFVYSVGDLLEGFTTMRRLADHDRLIVPGHDPAVFDRYPSFGPGTEGVAVRLDGGPVS